LPPTWPWPGSNSITERKFPMSEHTYRKMEIVGSSKVSVEEAIK
jgi:hypothetical protein